MSDIPRFTTGATCATLSEGSMLVAGHLVMLVLQDEMEGIAKQIYH